MKKLFLLALLLQLGGCAINRAAPISSFNRSEMSEANAYYQFVQDEVVVAAADPGIAASGGLIPALIDSVVAGKRQLAVQARVEPFYDSIDDMDVRADVWRALVPLIKSEFPVKIANLKTTVIGLTLDELSNARRSTEPGKGFLHIGTTYRLSPDFSRFEMVTAINLWRAGRADAGPIYGNVFTYQSAPIAASADPLKEWGADSGKLYRAAVREAISEMNKMMRLDLQGAPATGNLVTARQITQFGSVSNVSGPALEEQPSRVLLRNRQGHLFSLSR